MKKMNLLKKSNGNILKGPVDAGSMGKYIVIKDPAGAYCALWEKLIK
jgi:predicted enzyme related to lactoylglutathione lyase